jgi:hypothetical protein
LRGREGRDVAYGCGALADADAASRDKLLDPPSTTLARKRHHSGYALIMPYDPAKVMKAPPRYQPAAEAHDEERGLVYDENNPPTWKDFMKAANRARKMLKDLKR